MDNQLKTLISIYEEEKISLQKLIDESIADSEYLIAYYHSKALSQLNHKLQTLHNIDDKFYDKKRSVQRTIAYHQNELDSATSDYMKQLHLRELEHAKAHLEKIKDSSQATSDPETENLLDTALRKLMHKEIKNLRLILSKEHNFYFAFTGNQKMLKATIPNVRQVLKTWMLNDDTLATLQLMGFRPDVHGNKLSIIYTGVKEEILPRMQILVAKIVFDLFYFDVFRNQSYLEYTEKAK